MTAPRPDWLDDDARHCWHPYTQHALEPEPLPVVGAEGAWLELADGRRLLDAISSWWAVLHGHGEPRLVEAMQRQARTLDHVLYAGCAHEPASRLAAELVEVAPEGLTRAFMSDDGSTAVEVALKAAYQVALRRGEQGRRLFVALEGGYHGDTFGAMAVGDPSPFFREFGPLLFEVEHVPADADALTDVFERRGSEIAAFVAEPGVQGAAGMVVVPDELWTRARELCTEHGALLIADEVMTGFGRTGRLFASDVAPPDLLCLAKGLTGGMLPLAATLATEDIFESFLADDRAKTFFHGHTFTAHAIGCAVARESLALTRERDVPGRLAAIGRIVEDGLTDLRDRPGVRDLRRRGGIVALELETGDAGYLSGLGERLREACRAPDLDVLLRPLGNVLYALPPACTTDDEATRIARALRRVATSVL